MRQELAAETFDMGHDEIIWAEYSAAIRTHLRLLERLAELVNPSTLRR